MLLTIRENPSKRSVEFIWNRESTIHKGTRPFFEKPIEELESFFRSWESLVFRSGEGEMSPEVFEELRRKRDWLGGLVGWGHALDSEGTSSLHGGNELIVQSDTRWISLPWELLVEGNFGKTKPILVVREFLAPKMHYPSVDTKHAFFLFQTEFGGKIEESLEREYFFLQTLDWKEAEPKFYKNGLARVERLKEILPRSRVFYLASHLDKENWRLPDGSVLTRSELESMNLSGLELVFLNACYSAFGLAQSFLRCGAKEVIGFSTPVPNSVSEKVSRIFWSEYVKTGSSLQSFRLVEKSLSNTIFRYSWIRFGELPIPSRIRKNRILYGLVSTFLIALSAGIWIYERSTKNSSIPEILHSSEKTIPIQPPVTNKKSIIATETKPRKPSIQPIPSESISPTIESISPQVFKDSQPIPTARNVNSDLNLEGIDSELRNRILGYLNDDSEVLNREKRILVVRRILDMDKSNSWKEEAFYTETGR